MTALTLTETLSKEITSWVGTSMTMTRRSTRTICWMNGITMISPGPLTLSNRPSVKITPRSYSRRILMVLASRRTSTTTMVVTKYRKSTFIAELLFSVFEATWRIRRTGRSARRPARNPHLPYRRPSPCRRARRDGWIWRASPRLQVYPALAVAEIRDGFGLFTGQRLASAKPRLANRSRGQPDDGAEYQGRAEAHARDQAGIHLEPRNAGIEQDDRAEHHRDDAAYAQDAERRYEQLHGDQRQAQRHECEAGVVDREDLKCVQGQQQTDAADDPGYQGAGVVAFKNEPVDADHQQNVGQRRIGDDGQQFGAPVGLDFHCLETCGRKRSGAFVHPHGPPVDGVEQLRQMLGDDVDDVALQRLGCGQADRFAHGAFGPLGVSAVTIGQALDIGNRVVDRLARRGVAGDGLRSLRGFVRCGALGGIRVFGGSIRRIRFAAVGFALEGFPSPFDRRGRLPVTATSATNLHRRGRPQVGRRCHRGDVACIEHVGAGTGRA